MWLLLAAYAAGGVAAGRKWGLYARARGPTTPRLTRST